MEIMIVGSTDIIYSGGIGAVAREWSMTLDSFKTTSRRVVESKISVGSLLSVERKDILKYNN